MLWPCFVCGSDAICRHRERDLVEWAATQPAWSREALAAPPEPSSKPLLTEDDVPIEHAEWIVKRGRVMPVERTQRREKPMRKRMPWPVDYAGVRVEQRRAV